MTYQKLSILGSTGSIGTQALEVVQKHNSEVIALTAYHNIDILEKQIRQFKPQYAAVYNEEKAEALKIQVNDTNTKVLSGEEGICFCAELEDNDIVLNAVVGMAGLKPTLAAIRAKKDIALANKETLVAGGSLVMNRAKENNVKILPVDSEHSAIFQCLQGAPSNNALKRLILTASGGPFRSYTRKQLEQVTLAQALKHPNWSMGAKITVDSATMMNKGLELIEAYWLFSIPENQIDILVHKESIIHSMVEYDDNSVIAQLGTPDMRVPIQYALTYPERYPSPAETLSLSQIGTLTFEEPDEDTFGCLRLARRAIQNGGIMPTVLNAANEEANALFRNKSIRFLDIEEMVEAALSDIKNQDIKSLDDIQHADALAREIVRKRVKA